MENPVDIGSSDLVEEHPGIGGEGFHVSPLAFGKDGVESQRGFSGSGQTGDDGDEVVRNGKRDILEVVLPGALDNEGTES
jgi:hypothetical protein